MTRRSAFTFYTTPFAIACASLCREGQRGVATPRLACVLFSVLLLRAWPGRDKSEEEPEFDRFIYLFTSPEYGSTVYATCTVPRAAHTHAHMPRQLTARLSTLVL